MKRKRIYRSAETFVCPNCGAEVSVGAAACAECGADEETGWSEDATYDGADLPETGYGREEREDVGSAGLLWKVVALIVVILSAMLVFSRFF